MGSGRGLVIKIRAMLTPLQIPYHNLALLYLSCGHLFGLAMTRFLRRILPIGLAVALLLYALKDTSLADIGAQFRRADYGWLLAAALIMGLYNVVRAARWQLTLQALGYHPTVFRATIALLAGTLASMIVPGAGELTRCGTLQRTDDIPLAEGIGSVVAERVIDLLMLALVIGLTFLLEFRRVGQYLTGLLSPVTTRFFRNDHTEQILSGVALVGVFLLGIAWWLFRKKAFRQHRFIVRVAGVGRDVGRGFLSIRQLQRPGLFIFLTFVSHAMVFLAIYTLLLASTQTASFPPTTALTILTVSSLGGMAVPTQSGLGTYHFLVSRALMLYGLTAAEGVVIATFLHAVQTGVALLLSSLSFLAIPFLIAAKRAKPTGSLTE